MDLARLAARALAVLLLSLSPALAGDRALIDFFGYSPDGKYFAFEEYGIQDGSGLAWSSIYVVDLVADKWMYGSPFDARAREDRPDTPLAEIRDEARRKAHDKLTELSIGKPVEILALLGDGVPDADGKSLVFSSPSCCGPGETAPDRSVLTLSTFESTGGAECETLTGTRPLGYALALEGGGKPVKLHRDRSRLPYSRGCPTDYRLYAVVRPFDTNGPRVAVVSSYPFGFEGPDRRFLVVPIDRP